MYSLALCWMSENQYKQNPNWCHYPLTSNCLLFTQGGMQLLKSGIILMSNVTNNKTKQMPRTFQDIFEGTFGRPYQSFQFPTCFTSPELGESEESIFLFLVVLRIKTIFLGFLGVSRKQCFHDLCTWKTKRVKKEM